VRDAGLCDGELVPSINEMKEVVLVQTLDHSKRIYMCLTSCCVDQDPLGHQVRHHQRALERRTDDRRRKSIIGSPKVLSKLFDPIRLEGIQGRHKVEAFAFTWSLKVMGKTQAFCRREERLDKELERVDCAWDLEKDAEQHIDRLHFGFF
jgi:hypothetical protein